MPSTDLDTIVADLAEMRRRIDSLSESRAVTLEVVTTLRQQLHDVNTLVARHLVENAGRLALLEQRSPEDTAAQLALIREQVRGLATHVDVIDHDGSRAGYRRAAGAQAVSSERGFRGVLAVVAAVAATLSALLVELVRWLRGG